MGKLARRLAVTLAACACMGLATAGSALAALPQFGDAVCTGGGIHAGSYASLRIAGLCRIPHSATVVVRGDLTVGHHGLLNAVTPGTLVVHGDFVVRSGGGAGVGCSPAAGCSVTTNDRIFGSVIADQPLFLIFHSDWVGGNITSSGGGGGITCNSTALFGGPVFSTFEDSTVGGHVSLADLHSCWFGFFRNNVAGSVWVTGSRMADPDANEIQTNTIGGDLVCYHDGPKPQSGDSGGLHNIVAGMEVGQCVGL
jgi:hypothetical protein